VTDREGRDPVHKRGKGLSLQTSLTPLLIPVVYYSLVDFSPGFVLDIIINDTFRYY
jgi:hypothetical protein